jgi:NAD+ kinase
LTRSKAPDAPRVALIVKRTAYDLASEAPDDRLHDLLEQGDPTVANVVAAHEEHVATVADVREALSALGANVTRIRKRTKKIPDGKFDLVVTVGGDGTLLRASHGVGGTPVLGINSAPSFSVGFFCGDRKDDDIEKTLRAAFNGKLARAALTRMQVALRGEVIHKRVLNDALFCHLSPAATSRYIMEYGGKIEEHKSSGFWIGPAAGSTAAQRSAGGKVLPLSSRSLQCVVRELYMPRGKRPAFEIFKVKSGTKLKVRSKARRMRMYLDGPDTAVKVGLGDVIEFCESPEPLTLYGVNVRRKWKEHAVAANGKSAKA